MADSFIFYTSWVKSIQGLSDDVRLEIYDAIFEYVATREIPALKSMAALAFNFIKEDIDRNFQKYEVLKNTRSEAGRAGATARWQNKKMANDSKNSKRILPLANDSKNSLNDNVNVNVNVNNKENKKESAIKIFEDFRKKFAGTKRGLQTEFDNFQKKHSDWQNVISLLLPALINQEKWRAAAKAAGAFVPQWKNLQTWINQRCWEDELNFNFEKSNNGRETNSGVPRVPNRDEADYRTDVF
ncbi:MAG: DUF6291 domain-containing protein [Lentimicrobiaceae bacterium]|jgi:hypothetical protein|nr:DUF6291 domain-containing protein [Lentimicrobiaceae bacterium]